MVSEIVILGQKWLKIAPKKFDVWVLTSHPALRRGGVSRGRVFGEKKKTFWWTPYIKHNGMLVQNIFVLFIPTKLSWGFTLVFFNLKMALL